MKDIKDPQALAREAAGEYRECYGDDLFSAVLYGSAAGGDFDSRKSDINLLLILRECLLPSLEKSAYIQEKWIKRRISRPLFMDIEYIRSSLDTFPVEFLSIRQHYQVLWGDDLIGGLVIEPRHLRLQLEREFKGKRLHLMQSWLEVRKSRRRLAQLIEISLRDFEPCFRALLHLKGLPNPESREALLGAVEEACALEAGPFRAVRSAGRSRVLAEMLEAFPLYSRAVKALSDIVDQSSEENKS